MAKYIFSCTVDAGFSLEDFVFGEPDKDEVYEAGDVMSRYMSSLGGGQQLEDDELDFSDVYEAQVYDLPG
ncbi:hypothetical protein Tco_1461389 [Tanacetum coccineum]